MYLRVSMHAPSILLSCPLPPSSLAGYLPAISPRLARPTMCNALSRAVSRTHDVSASPLYCMHDIPLPTSLYHTITGAGLVTGR